MSAHCIELLYFFYKIVYVGEAHIIFQPYGQ